MMRESQSRLSQDIVTGIDFIGAGAILKLNNEQAVTALATAAGVCMTAAIGAAAGLGCLGVALLANNKDE